MGYRSAALARLKPFQLRSAEHAFNRLYSSGDGSDRFLIADEVGLGKTLVASAVTAMAIDHLQAQGTPRIDVIYICANQAIARQNIDRIKNLLGVETRALARRITLLPHSLKSLDARVNLIAFTPATSFGSASPEGVVEERVILYRMLERVWGGIEPGAGDVFRGSLASAERFHEYNRWIERRDFEPGLFDRFAGSVGGREGKLYRRFLDVRNQLTLDPGTDAVMARRALIAELRLRLAHACLDALEPDLVILDEFQRFRHLLDEGTASGELAARLFEYEDPHTRTRTLLLSATPYKMYTITGEPGENHYHDFLGTVKFLEGSKREEIPLEDQLRQFRMMLPRAVSPDGENSTGELRNLRSRIETRLRKVMTRTERRGGGGGSDPMLEVVPAAATLSPGDIKSFLSARDLARAVNAPAVMEYWKSSPYLLTFMDQYRLAQKVRARVDSNPSGPTAALVRAGADLQIPRSRIRSRRNLQPGNGRMRALFDLMQESGLQRALWLPPSLCSYRLGRDFERARKASKLLVFSSWKMAPRAISVLTSYDAERRYIRSPKEAEAFKSDRLAIKATAYSLMTLVAPSHTLAEAGDSLRHRARNGPELLRATAKRLRSKVDAVTARVSGDGTRQATLWYAVAPFLLDSLSGSDLEWIEGPPAGSGERMSSAWPRLVARIRDCVANPSAMGPPPADLLDVLAAMAVGSPANCALRSLSRITGRHLSDHSLKRSAMVAGWAFRALFRTPTSEGLLQSAYKPKIAGGSRPYWRRALSYAIEGGLTDVLDEYFFVLREGAGFDLGPDQLVEALGKTAHLPVRGLATHHWARNRGGVRHESRNMRQHIARRFGADAQFLDASEHPDSIRAAFNSPFWPFVLSSTSIGQEGLDFHWYCHSIMHWNLPPNPVDLEQREGRVHRYHGHAIRKNISSVVGERALAHASAKCLAGRPCNPWESAYRLADEEFGSDGGLRPHWVFEAGGARIRRYAPVLPLSRDESRMEDLRRSLAIYRMVFGQPRQQDLVEFFLREVPIRNQSGLLKELAIDLSPPD
ncbi:MAG: hypothetical protein F4X41_05385 [Chloroflexi bacterium]|nr:hypothetical protein [Chloroflexota bacterium]